MEIASEPITDESWLGVPTGTVFSIDPDVHIHFEPMDQEILEMVLGAPETEENMAE